MKALLRNTLLAGILLLLFSPLTLDAQWRKLAAYSTTFFNEVFFIDANRGWLTQFNGTVLYTADGGSSWQSAALPGFAGSANRDVFFLSTSLGFCSGEDGIWKSTNGGVSWTNITPAGAVLNRSSSSWFIDANTGVWGLGSCLDTTVTFYRTTNGGVSWNSVTYSHPADVAVGGMTYSGGSFYAAGGSGKYWASSDNGATWSYGNTGSGGWQEDLISFGSTLYAASANGTSCGSTGGGVILRSTNGGANWTLSTFPTIVMWGVTMYSATNGWSCGDGGRAFRTTDAGTTWMEADCGMNRIDRIDDIHFTDATHGWAVGDGIYKFVGDSWSTRPDTIDFGDILVGARSADSNAALRALGSSITVLGRQIAGVDASQFAATGSLGTQSILSCQDGLTPIHFQPTSVGVKIARLDYSLNGSPDVPVVYLKGRGVKPKLAANSLIQFDTLRCLQDRIDSLLVFNEGNYPLVINSVNFTGLLSGSFQLLSPVLPVTILPGARRYLHIRASSNTPGAFSGMMSIVSNDPDSSKSPWNVRLTAFRQEIAVKLNLPDTLLLPPVPINSQSNGCILYINGGNGPQMIEGLTALDLEPTIIHAPIVAGVRLLPNGQQGLCFSVFAVDTGLHVRRFRVRTQPCMVDTIITVMFRAVNPSVASVTELRVPIVCTDSTTERLVLRNRGNAPLILDSPAITGTSSAEFSLIAPLVWPVTVAVGDSVEVTLKFRPAPVGPPDRLATITFGTNDRTPGKSLWSVLLRGRRETSLMKPVRTSIDLGDICVDTWSATGFLPVRNDGSVAIASARIDTILSTTTNVQVETGSLAGIPIAVVDSFAVRVQPHSVGPFVVRVIVSWLPCGRPDTVTLTGRGVRLDLQASPTGVDFAAVRPGVETQRTVRITNHGNSIATITAWNFQPSIPGLRVVSPAPPVLLGPDESRDVVVALNPADTGDIQSTLVAVGEGTCPDSLATPIVARSTRASVTSNRFAVDFGTLSTCNDLGSTDTVRLTNAGDLPVTVTGLALAAGTLFSLPAAPSPPFVIAPGSTHTLLVAVRPGLVGLARDTLVVDLDQPDLPRLRVPLAARRESADLSVNWSEGNDSLNVRFDTLTSCSVEDQQRVVLLNRGTIPDTVDLSVVGQSFSLVGPARVVISPRDSAIVSVIARYGNGTTPLGLSQGQLVVAASPCDRRRELSLATFIGSGVSTVADLVLGTSLTGITISSTTLITGRGNFDQRIESIILEQQGSEFEIDRDYRGTMVQAGGTLPVGVSCRPMTAGVRECRLIVIYDSPCRDTVLSRVTAFGLAPEDRRLVVVESTPTRGRWGHTVRLPVWLLNPQSASFDSIRVSLSVAADLLDISEVVKNNGLGNQWRIDQVVTDRIQGKVSFTLRRLDTAEVLPTVAPAAYVECMVLRGSRITSDVKLEVAGLPNHIADSLIDGDFALEDYCDAHGRLLSVGGAFALEQNVPNPFNPVTVIEFETAFEGAVTLVVYDAGGVEVLRLIDEVLPRGRRRVALDARNLASGVYTYRLTSGLQSQTRRMVLVK